MTAERRAARGCARRSPPCSPSPAAAPRTGVRRRRRFETPFAPTAEPAASPSAGGGGGSSRDAKVARWLERYPPTPLDRRRRSTGGRRPWTVHVWSGAAGEIATGDVEDADGRVSEAWTGPAGRVEDGARARRRVRRHDAHSWPGLAALCALFFLGLVDRRRPLSLRNARPARRCSRSASRSGSSTAARSSGACRSP